jgi:hypothetical protein
MTINGFDISDFQSALTADSLRHLIVADGYQFGGIKAGEGDYQVDPHFGANREACRANAFPRFIYWEVNPSSPVSANLAKIMEATGGRLYPRERLALVLGDFHVTPDYALALANQAEANGPPKRTRGGHAHSTPVLYANESNWTTVYTDTGFRPYPKWVAAFPGSPAVWNIPGAVAHQDSDHDPATHGDHDVWNPRATSADMVRFFRG